MKEYFEAEMRLLTGAAQEFAERYPEQARMLNLKSLQDRDPYIERLLEGFAFLMAQIRQKIDDSIPEISENLLQQLWPQMLTPLPAMTIMEFSFQADEFKSITIIPEGTVITTEPIGDKNPQVCTFKTTSSVIINPLIISNVTLQEATAGGCFLKVDFKTEGQPLSKLNLNNFRLYLSGDLQIATQLHFMLTRQSQMVKVVYTDKVGTEIVHNLGADGIQPWMLTAEETYNVYDNRKFFGFHLIQEYFAFREKYLFLTIQNLDQIKWSDNCYTFSLLIQIKINLPSNYHITKENFCLHCVPAINLFAKTAEPIVFDNRRLKYRVVADIHYPESTIVHSVRQLNAKINAENSEQATFHLNNNSRHSGNNDISYNLTRSNNDVYVLLNTKLDSAINNLSCDITACNGNYPYRYIADRQISQNLSSNPSIRITNLTRPTPMYCHKDSDFCWSLISHLSLNYMSLASTENLQNLLRTYNWTESVSNRNRIDSITSVAITPITSIRRGAIMQGVEFKLTMREVLFSSLADIHLFGLILHHFFSMYVWLNFFVITKVVCDPSGKELVWQPISGLNYMI
jgi:type VI secretion system protein ImpG